MIYLRYVASLFVDTAALKFCSFLMRAAATDCGWQNTPVTSTDTESAIARPEIRQEMYYIVLK